MRSMYVAIVRFYFYVAAFSPVLQSFSHCISIETFFFRCSFSGRNDSILLRAKKQKIEFFTLSRSMISFTVNAMFGMIPGANTLY